MTQDAPMFCQKIALFAEDTATGAARDSRRGSVSEEPVWVGRMKADPPVV